MKLPHLDETLRFLQQGDNFLLTSHVNSDGDGIGGCLALQRMLRQMNKTAVVVLHDRPDKHFDFLSGWAQIQQAVPVPPRQHKYVVVLDCPRRDRIGTVERHVGPDEVLLNLDHHPGNDAFGHTNLVAPDTSSACEILYHLAVAAGLRIDADTAAQLYAGIIFDTGCFRYSLATATTLEVAADLVRRGAPLDLIADRVFGGRTLTEVKQLGQALRTLALHFDGRVATLHLTYGQLRSGDPEDIVNYGLLIRDVQAAILLKEQEPGQYRVSLRSREQVDVSKVAALFGGGGHTKASGCRMEGAREEVQARLLEAIGQRLN